MFKKIENEVKFGALFGIITIIAIIVFFKILSNIFIL